MLYEHDVGDCIINSKMFKAMKANAETAIITSPITEKRIAG